MPNVLDPSVPLHRRRRRRLRRGDDDEPEREGRGDEEEEEEEDESNLSSLGIVTDEKALARGSWSEEDDDDDGETTPRLFPDVGEEDDDNDVFTFSKRSTRIPSRSGAWSSFSWSSLYDRAADSSLSWADDELERETTERVASMFRQIDDALYQDGIDGDDAERTPPSLQQRQQQQQGRRRSSTVSLRPRSKSLSDEIRQECGIWRDKFPHLRVVGRAAEMHSPPQTHVPNSSNVPADPRVMDAAAEWRKAGPTQGFSESDDDSLDEGVPASAARLMEAEAEEELLRLGGMTLNEKFEEDPLGYFEDKVLSAVFRRAWATLSEELSELIDVYGERVIQESMEMQSLSSRESSAVGGGGGRSRNVGANLGMAMEYRRRDTLLDSAIDENDVFQQQPYPAVATSMAGIRGRGIGLPLRSRLGSGDDDGNPVSLPNLAMGGGGGMGGRGPPPSSAPPARDDLGGGRRPISSQQSVYRQGGGGGGGGRPRRTNSFKGDRAVAASNGNRLSPDRLQQHQDGVSSRWGRRGGTGSQSRPFRRLRSHSGSPPRGRLSSAASSSATARRGGGFSGHTQQQQSNLLMGGGGGGGGRLPPLSLPPIQGTLTPSSSALTLTSRSGAGSAATSRGTPRSSGIGSSVKSTPRSSLLSTGQASPSATTADSSRGSSGSGGGSFSVAGKRLQSLKNPRKPPPPPSAGQQQSQTGIDSHQQQQQQQQQQQRTLSRMSLASNSIWDSSTAADRTASAASNNPRARGRIL